MTALWPVTHRCGHRVEWDLSRKHPEDRAGFARWLALRDCTRCWWAKRRKQRPTKPTSPARERTNWLSDWEEATGMPALSGGDKAVAWARRIRLRLITAAVPPSVRANGTTDEAIVDLVGHARTITGAGWWIDHRKIEPRHLPVLLDRASNARSRR